MPLRMFIVVPESCLCPAVVEEGDTLVDSKAYVQCSASRAGHQHRDYKSPIYALRDMDDLDANGKPKVRESGSETL